MEKEWWKKYYQENAGILDLRSTGMTRLPDSVRDLKGLRLLDLSGLALTELPDWLADLGLPFSREPDGDGVRLYETTVEGIDMVIFDQPYEVVAEWFRVRRQSYVQPLNEIKVVFLGDGESGKSHTIARLMNDGAEPISYMDESTPGIAIRSKEYDLGGRRIRVNYWDFGGQEIMHSMHRIFLTDRTMYVVMLNAREDTQGERARYWLHNIKAFAPDAPVLLVLNKIDQNTRASVDERTLRARYPGLRAVVHLSALRYNQEEFNRSFTSVLLEEIQKTGYLEVQWPASWKRVKQALETMPQAYITGDEYLRICEACNVDENQKDLLHWFNDLGVSFCLSNEEDYALEDYVILRPDWITNAIYILLFNKIEGAVNGLVPHKSIYRMLRSTYSDSWIRRLVPNARYNSGDIQYVLGTMRKLGLSFQDGQDNEFIPMLCWQDAAVDVWAYEEDADTMQFNMEFEYLPDNLLHQLMVERYTELDLSRVWRTGAVFRLPALGLSAVVVIDGSLLRFFVRTDSNNHSPNTYLVMLQESVNRIRLRMGLEEPVNMIVYKLEGRSDSFPYEELTAAVEAGQTAIYSRGFRRMVPIADILRDDKSKAKQNKDKLIAQMAGACINLQKTSLSLGLDEGSANVCVQDYLREQGYIVNDQRYRGMDNNDDHGRELDMLICDRDHLPLAACEIFMIKDKSNMRIWNDHLAKILTDYATSDLPTKFLISFVECGLSEYHKWWSNYNDHMRKYNPKHGKRMGEYQHVLPLPELPEYLRVARCTYDIGGTAVTVYHYFVHMGSRDQMDTAVEIEQQMRLEQAQVEIAMLQSELTQLKVKSATEFSDRNQLELMLNTSKVEIESLTTALAHAQNEVDNALAESQQANAKAEMYAVEIEVLRSDKEQLNAELLVTHSSLEHNHILLREAEHAAHAAEEDRKRMEVELKKLLDELERLHAEIAEQHGRLQKLSEEQNINRKNDEKAATIAEMISRLEQKKQELTMVESAAKKAVQTQKQYENLVIELERKQQELRVVMAHAEAAKSDREELEKLYADSKKRQLAAQESAVAVQRENALLAEKLVEHTRQIQSLEEALREAQSKVIEESEEEDDGQQEEVADDALITKEYRVIILGDSEAGKSQILHRLRYPKRNPKKFPGDVTPGIDIASRVFAIDDEHVRVNFWDFGGQEILHSLHRLFLAKNTMYVIVLNTRNDNQDEQAKFWLHYVELYATGAPVVLVLNKIDQNPTAALDMPALRRTFRYEADILDVLRISAREWNQEEFQQGFVDALCDHIKARMNETNSFTEAELRIRDEVRAQNEGKQIVEMEDFKRICKKGNLPEGTNANKLAERFHKAGMLVYFGTRTNMIMDPDWITNIIYRILDSGATRATNGILDHETIEDVLCEDEKLGYRKSQIDFVWKIMQKYGLSFQYQAPVHDLPELEFVPVLCRHDEPTGVTAFISRIDVIQMHMIFRYLSAGVLYQLMVDLKAEMCEDGVWLSGATFENDGCKAVVIREKDRMKFYVHGENRVLALRYLESLRERVEGIARGDMYNATAQETLLGYYIADSGDVEFFDYDRLNLSKEYELNYAMSKIKPGTLVVRDILDQRDGAYIHERDTLLGLVLKGCIDIQKDPKYSANKADENDRNRELARRIEGKFITKDQTQGGLSGSGEGIGELDIEILNDNKMPIAILEALNTTSINTANWRDHLNKLVDNYNTSGLRYLVLTSYVPCKKSKFIDKFKETSEHWKKVEPKGLEGCLESVDTLVMDECPELIRITRADYVRNNFKVSVYHFLVHISGEDDDATADA